MGLYFDEQNGDKMIDGTSNCLAVLHAGGKQLEIWDTDGESHLGMMPVGSTAEQINAAVKFFDSGVELGKRLGKIQKQTEFKTCLGIE